MRVLRIFRASVGISVQRELAHRANFFFAAALSVFRTLAGLLAVFVVFSQTRTLAGWTLGEVLVLLGTFQVMTGLMESLVEPNVGWFPNRVRDGQLDDLLLMPAPSLFLATLGTTQPWALSEVAAGAVTLSLGFARLGAPEASHTWAALVLLAAGTVVAWATRAIVASLAFWAPGIDPTIVYGSFWQLGRYPVDIYPRLVRYALRFVVPVALVATVPAHALAHGAGAPLQTGAVVAASLSIGVVRKVWGAGLRRYLSASS